MNAMTRLAIATLEHSDPSALEAWARERLTTHAGFTVFAPDDKDAADTWALDRVRAMGRRVVDADATVLPKLKAPAVGVWRPRRTTSLPRNVLRVEGGFVSYATVWVSDDEFGHLPVTPVERCTVAVFHRWQRRTRAVAS